MSRVHDLVRAICTDLEEALPPVTARLYEGEFEAESQRRVRLAPPMVLVAPLGAKPGHDRGTGEWEVDVRLAAFCVHRSPQPGRRQEDALSLAEAVATRAHLNETWGGAAAGLGELEQLENLFSLSGEQAFSVWGVTWRQPILLGESIWDGDGEIPTEIWVGFDAESYPEDYEEQSHE
ncbi:MAG: hypothetical protein ACLFVF_06850 [Thiohalospira sp.]